MTDILKFIRVSDIISVVSLGILSSMAIISNTQIGYIFIMLYSSFFAITYMILYRFNETPSTKLRLQNHTNKYFAFVLVVNNGHREPDVIDYVIAPDEVVEIDENTETITIQE